jgi:hypothetical protein
VSKPPSPAFTPVKSYSDFNQESRGNTTLNILSEKNLKNLTTASFVQISFNLHAAKPSFFTNLNLQVIWSSRMSVYRRPEILWPTGQRRETATECRP